MNQKHDWNKVIQLYNDGTPVPKITSQLETHPSKSEIYYILTQNPGVVLRKDDSLSKNTTRPDWNNGKHAMTIPDISEEQMTLRARRLYEQARTAIREETQ